MAFDFQFGVLASILSGDARAAAASARQAGFSGLIFDAKTAGLDLISLSASGRREFLRMLSLENQRLIALRPAGVPGGDVDKLLWGWQRVLETAAGLKAQLVCLDLGPLPKEPQAMLAELGRLADRFSVMLALRSDLDTFASFDAALRSANCPWFGVDLDPVSLLTDEWSMEDTISRIGALVRHVRARDALLGANRRTRPAIVGQGSVDWGKLLRLLDESGYHGWITLDPMELADRARAAAAGLKYLQTPE